MGARIASTSTLCGDVTIRASEKCEREFFIGNWL